VYKAVKQPEDVGLMLMLLMRLWWLLLLLLLLVRVVMVLGRSLLAGRMLQLLLGSSHPL